MSTFTITTPLRDGDARRAFLAARERDGELIYLGYVADVDEYLIQRDGRLEVLTGAAVGVLATEHNLTTTR